MQSESLRLFNWVQVRENGVVCRQERLFPVAGKAGVLRGTTGRLDGPLPGMEGS